MITRFVRLSKIVDWLHLNSGDPAYETTSPMDGYRKFLTDNGATGETLHDMERSYLAALGFQNGTLHDTWGDYLNSLAIETDKPTLRQRLFTFFETILVSAPVATLLDAQLATPTGTVTTGTISPADDSWIVITCGTATLAGNFAFSSTTLSNIGSWTLVQVADGNIRVGILYAKITGSAGTGTITISGFGTPGVTRAIMHTTQITGAVSALNPKTGTITSASPSITLDATPGAKSLVIANIGHNAAATTPGTGYTELAENNGNRGMQTQYDAEDATTTVAWTSSNVSHAMAALEFSPL